MRRISWIIAEFSLVVSRLMTRAPLSEMVMLPIVCDGVAVVRPLLSGNRRTPRIETSGGSSGAAGP